MCKVKRQVAALLAVVLYAQPLAALAWPAESSQYLPSSHLRTLALSAPAHLGPNVRTVAPAHLRPVALSAPSHLGADVSTVAPAHRRTRCVCVFVRGRRSVPRRHACLLDWSGERLGGIDEQR